MSGDINELIELLREETAKRKKRSVRLRWIVGSVVGICLTAWLIVVISTGHGAPDLVTPLPLLIFGAIAAMAYSPRHKSLVAELAARKDPRIFSHLLEAAHIQELEVRKLAEGALPDVLGVWLSCDEQSLDPEHRFLLYRLLDPTRPVELVEAALITVRAVGGSEALPYLESFKTKIEGKRQSSWNRLTNKALETMADVRLREARRIIEAGPLFEHRDAVEQEA